jgi:hypothetical protein
MYPADVCVFVFSVVESEGGVLVIGSEAENSFAVDFGVGEVFPEN